jgi:FAD/FMN-containing dehydrogenase
VNRIPGRRTFLAKALAAAGMAAIAPLRALAAASLRVGNVSGLYDVEVARVAIPQGTSDIVEQVRNWPGHVAVGGGRFSMGGQAALHGGLHLDMRGMNRLVWLKPAERLVRVQAGMTWRDLQDHLDPLGLAVKTMQSYSNFTVGGSVSVNAHGRYVGHGPVGHTVRALQLVTVDGAAIETSFQDRPELFRAAIGGYGGVGVITELELEVADNVRIQRRIQRVALQAYPQHFRREVAADRRAVLHNADLLPPRFDRLVSVTWMRAPDDLPLTVQERLVPRGRSYAMEQGAIWALTELPGGRRLRKAVVEPARGARAAVKWLNHEASLDVAELEPRNRKRSTYVLQEYFIPVRHFVPFARDLARVLVRHDAEVLNVSIRHSPADTVSLLPWAPEEVFSFVVYFKQRTTRAAQQKVALWTRELIELALKDGGRYYLPYQLHATQGQFDRAYPEADRLRELRARIDPHGRFSNELWRKYL